MNRILNLIAKYDENLTIAQFKKAIEADKRIADQKEIDDLNQLKEEFANTYLKIIDEEHMFGKTLNVYHIEKITRTERSTDWSLYYHVKGTKVSFSERDTYCRALNSKKDSFGFSEEELREMTKITEQEYDEYVHQYATIKTMLTEIVK
jgi:hypothetical protein